ncbi:MAG TPA: hypothetical protein VK463_15515 [Desulfomonilaceae bacterium]|nr:hypothetical protein [Desulfomonilaceae bacterium]
MNRDALNEKFQALVAAHGNNWKRIVEELSEANIPHPKGKQWTRDNTRTYYRSIKQQPEPPSPVQSLPEWLDDSAVLDLRTMLEWWRTKKDESLILLPGRPVFKGRRKNTGVHCNEVILYRAVEKLKKDKVRTGGSLSLLVEYLLWEYIGRPPDVLEPVPNEKPDAWSVLHAAKAADYED